MGDAVAARLQASVRRLSRRARLRRGLQGGARGLFYGLLAAFLIAAASGSVSLPRPILLAGAAACAGAVIGAAAGLLRRIHQRRLLFEADRLLGSRELLGTGHELASAAAAAGVANRGTAVTATGAGGTFAQAVVEDAAGLLGRSRPRQALGKLELRLAPFLPVAAALVVAAFLFPVDILSLLAPQDSSAQMASIGEDLRGLGEQLEGSSRAQDLGRRLALSQELAQLGRDLADHRITADDALDRIESLQQRVEREYQLQVQGAPGFAGAGPGSGQGAGRGAGAPGGSGTGSLAGPGDATAPGADGTAGANGGDSGGLGADAQTLSDALNRLRQAQDLLRKGDQAGGGSSGGNAGRSGATRQGSSAGGSPRSSPGGAAGSGSTGQGGTADLGGEGAGNGGSEGDSGGGGTGPAGSAPGTAPAPQKTGPPTDIARGSPTNMQRAQGTVGEGDSTSFLVRALPEWTGSRLPEETVRRDYAQAAEAALLRDEVPPDLKAAVRDYFTDIGMSAGTQGQGSGGQ